MNETDDKGRAAPLVVNWTTESGGPAFLQLDSDKYIPVDDILCLMLEQVGDNWDLMARTRNYSDYILGTYMSSTAAEAALHDLVVALGGFVGLDS